MTKRDRYLLELGRLVSVFAAVETRMLNLLWKASGLSDQVGAAVLSGVKIDGATGLLRRVFEANGGNCSGGLKSVLEHLGHINDMRNMLLHQAVYENEAGEMFVSNFQVAMSSREKRYQITPDALFAMSSDLTVIDRYLSLEMLSLAEIDRKHAREAQTGILRTPWRYKPLAERPVRKTSKPRTRDQGR